MAVPLFRNSVGSCCSLGCKVDIILKNTLNMKQISLHVYQSIDGCPAPSDKHFDAAVDAPVVC